MRTRGDPVVRDVDAEVKALREDPRDQVHVFKCRGCGEGHEHAWGEETATPDGLRVMHPGRGGEPCGPIVWGWRWRSL